MKANLLTVAISVTALTATIISWRLVIDVWPVHGRYYAAAIVLSSGLLAVIAAARIVRHTLARTMPTPTPDRETADKPRRHYRITYEKPARPIFVIKDDAQPNISNFNCWVVDISESGIGLSCIDRFTTGQTVQGEVIFKSGRTAAVDGIVVRHTTDGTYLELNRSIDSALLMAEQRSQIVMQRAGGPQPAISRAALEPRPKALPSHQLKGIRRSWRP